MVELYPLRFIPIYKEKLWGGQKLQQILSKKISDTKKYGESWEISAVENNVSIIENGFLAGNNLQEVIEVYMGDLVGEGVYDKFGIEFPLLIKFIDANEYLSIQVHPDDKTARKKHHANGKNEMWYIVQAEENAKVISGFNKKVTKNEFGNHLNKKTLPDILNYIPVLDKDALFIPAGRIHTIGRGVLLAEIQQTSDITYRIHDWDRTDEDGNRRELHNDLALEVLETEAVNDFKIDYVEKKNEKVSLTENPYFQVNVLEIDQVVDMDYAMQDSFVIYMNIEGEVRLEYGDKTETFVTGETILVPASLDIFRLVPMKKTRLLEIYIPKKKNTRR